ncbi:MFS transporter [Minwuia sp. IMCC3060]|uniref:MFS transporter n=1 Tax=Minwuia sp. IMCC3060 TaxID=3040675 RepID=UPI00247B0FA7|nr:MFS transporter [Minwuia sp. IMCC3060]
MLHRDTAPSRRASRPRQLVAMRPLRQIGEAMTVPTPEPRQTPHAPWQELLQGGHLPRFVVLCLGVWLHAADALMVATLMPSAVIEVGGAPWMGWTLALYEIGSVVAGAATGLLAVRIGLRLAMCGSASLFALGCLASAVAPDMAVILIGRLGQGLGGGALVAIVFVATDRLFPDRLLPVVMALISAIWGASAFCGPLIGGIFANAGLWRMGFVAFAVQAILLVLLALFLLRSDRPPRGRASSGAAAAVPWTRLLLLLLAIVSIATAGTLAAGVASVGLILLGVMILVTFFRLDRGAVVRLFPRNTLAIGSPVGGGILFVLFFSTGTISFTLYGPLLAQMRFGVSPLVGGYLVASESVAWTIAALAVSGLSQRHGMIVIRAGAALMTIGVLGLAMALPQGSIWSVLPFTFCLGAGFGAAWAFVLRRVIASALEGDRERASAAVPTTQMIGYGLGAALAGLFANLAGYADGIDAADTGVVGFWVFAGFAPILALGWLTLRGLSRCAESASAAAD